MCLMLGFVSPVFAETTEEELVELKARIQEMEQRLVQQDNNIDKKDVLSENSLQKKEVLSGISLEAGATFVHQATSNANGDDLSENDQDVGDASYSIDVCLTKEFENSVAFIALEAGEGVGADGELAVFSAVNADATGGDANISVTEVWYQHNLELFIFTFGKLAADAFMDSNEYANDEATQFLGAEFKHSSTIEFPENSAGLIIGVSFSDMVKAEAIVMDGNADWEDMFEDAFYGGQLTFSPEIAGKDGNYRVFGWRSKRDHTKWNDSSGIQENSYGFGLSADQELTDTIGVFARYAWQNPEVYLNGESYSLEYSYSVGIQITGEPWMRDNDVFGIAFGQIFISDNYKDAGGYQKADSEGHIEFYYSYKVNDHFTISPDVQIVMNPYGGDAINGDDTIVIAGIRGQIDF
ncbi:MAG: carbohydrate porin [Candidatus Aureabacteria bacterium]|nr:carbohydrate porin [Candidatus Auribacterota bacterium]